MSSLAPNLLLARRDLPELSYRKRPVIKVGQSRTHTILMQHSMPDQFHELNTLRSCVPGRALPFALAGCVHFSGRMRAGESLKSCDWAVL